MGVVGAKGGGKKNDGGFTYIFPYFSGQSLLFAVKYPLILNDSFAGTFESSSRFPRFCTIPRFALFSATTGHGVKLPPLIIR